MGFPRDLHAAVLRQSKTPVLCALRLRHLSGRLQRVLKSALNRWQNLRMLDHPNVVRLYEVNEDAEAGT